MSVWRMAKLQHVTPRHVRRVYEKYRGVKRPVLSPGGRRPRPITREEVELILSVRKEHPVGAVNLEKILGDMGRRMPHNRIHRLSGRVLRGLILRSGSLVGM